MPQIVGVLTNDERHQHMAEAIKLFPVMKRHPRFNDRMVSIVCYGPSLRDTWKDIPRPILTVSGAHDFLVSRGTVPDWHVDCDPRPHKAAMLKLPQLETKYLMASCCHPDFWEKLRGHRVRLWHLINGDDFETPAWVRKNHPLGMDIMMGGGTTVGMRAMEVCAALGFRRFNIFGMDCSFLAERHADKHLGAPQPIALARVGNRTFQTTLQMLEAAREMERFITTMDADVRFHGDGLMQATAQYLRHPSNLKVA